MARSKEKRLVKFARWYHLSSKFMIRRFPLVFSSISRKLERQGTRDVYGKAKTLREIITLL